MVKFKLYKNYFGNISFVMVDNFFCRSNQLVQLIDIFKPQHLIISVTALDQDSDFFKYVSNEKRRFKIILPTHNTITSETVIMSNTREFLPVYDLLLKSEPRCITIYELKENAEIDRINYREFQYADDTLVNEEGIGYAISVISEECCVKITFNNNLYDPVNLFKTIKKKLKEQSPSFGK